MSNSVINFKSNNIISSSGFTLVEIAIVMIIIGLLVGGIFGGMKLIDNASVQKTAQDLKSFESAITTFKDTYQALPGDIIDPATELPNCATAPCSRTGDGNGIIGDLISLNNGPITVTSEKFTMWSHLLAAGLTDKVVNQDDMTFGVGQIESPLGGGYRMSSYLEGNQIAVGHPYRPWGHQLFITDVPSDQVTAVNLQNHRFIPCAIIRSLDTKIDDGIPRYGKVMSNISCIVNTANPLEGYTNPNGLTSGIFIFKNWAR